MSHTLWNFLPRLYVVHITGKVGASTLATDALLGNTGATCGHLAVRGINDRLGLRGGAPSDDGITGFIRCESCLGYMPS